MSLPGVAGFGIHVLGIDENILRVFDLTSVVGFELEESVTWRSESLGTDASDSTWTAVHTVAAIAGLLVDKFDAVDEANGRCDN